MSRNIHPGTVYLVGAGPGDPELITVRGQRLLRGAEVIVYDRLIHGDLLKQTRRSAERLYVGKKPGTPSIPQAAINALLVTKARQGRIVVRLKGGDPFVFGRGGEEAGRMRAAGVPFEVVPGITSAIGVPAYAGIPVTHRGVARSFTVVTGHTCSLDDTALDWNHLAHVDTLVILMGLGRLPCITQHLIDAGRAPDAPVAVIRSGSTADQEVVTGTLATIDERTAHLRPPATIVVGEVARNYPALAWFDPPRRAAAFPIRPHEAGTSPPAPARVVPQRAPAFSA